MNYYKITVLTALFFTLFSSKSLAVEDGNYKFFSFTHCVLDNKGRTDDQVIKEILGKVKVKKSPEFGRSADISLNLAKEYCYPKPDSRLYLFNNSELIGKTVPKSYGLYSEDEKGLDATLSFSVDLKSLNISDQNIYGGRDTWSKYWKQGVLVSRVDGKPIQSLETTPSEYRNEKGISSWSISQCAEIISLARIEIEEITQGPWSRYYRFEKAFHFADENLTLISLKTLKTNLLNSVGKYIPTYILIIKGKDYCEVNKNRNVVQVFQIDGRKYVVLEWADSYYVGREILKTGPAGVEKIKQTGWSFQ
jgi:hypothetical protein